MVLAQIAPRFANTMFLAGVTAAIAVPLAVGPGILAALWRDTAFDKGANIATLSSISSPEFFVAYILILLFAVVNPVLPSLSNIFPGMSFGERLEKTLLPALTLTLLVTAHMMRMTRTAILNLMVQPYIEMARLKGMRPLRVIWRHALPNALASIVNVVALNLAYLVTGVVLVEVVFVYPGFGQLFVDSVKLHDIPVVQACCDEVTSALGQLVAEGILKLLARLQDELGLSYMFITHDLATVKAIADEVVVMKEGRVIEQGPKTEMFTLPHHTYTDLLLSSVPERDPDWLDRLLAERGVEALGEAAANKM